MNVISEAEINGLDKVIEEAGLYRVRSAEEFDAYVDNCMEGFDNRLLFSYICGGEFDEEIFRTLLCACYRSIENVYVYADSKNLNSCIMWIPSGIKINDILRGFKSAKSSFKKIGGMYILPNLIAYENAIKSTQKYINKKNSWLMFNYGCKKELNTDETFIKMMKPVVDYAWVTGRACYTGCSNESKMPPLRKLGFHIVDTVTFSKANIRMYGMMV